MYKKVCKHCNLEIECKNHQAFGAHITTCKSNPNYIIMITSQSEKAKLKNPIKNYTFNCKTCNEEYTLKLSLLQYNKNEYRKNCNILCSNSKRIVTDETKEKISKSLTGFISPKRKYSDDQYNKTCKCNKKLKFGNKSGLCKECIKTDPEYKKRLSASLKGKTGGYRTKSGTSKIHGSYYNNIWMDSSWELEFAKRLDFLNIIWERSNKYYFNYNKNGINKKYYPDFYIPIYDKYIEIKGYWTDENRLKMKLVKEQNKIDLIILEDINKIKNIELKDLHH